VIPLRRALLPILYVLALACDGGPAGLEPNDLVGRWVIRTAANPSCSGAAGAAERIFDADDPPVGDGVVNVVSQWDFVYPDRYDWLVTGNFNVRTKAVLLNFWQTPLSVGAEFTGTIREDGTLVGEVRDPKPGYLPHTVIGSCVFQATGERLN
jgi:hypothetical protein